MKTICLTALLVWVAGLCAAAPLQLHPDNPHYFLLRGKPTVLIASSEHYGAVLNRDFDYAQISRNAAGRRDEPDADIPRDVLRAGGASSTSPTTRWPRRPGASSAPGREHEPGLSGGGNKFDLTKWDDAYFARLKDFVAQAGKRGVVVELVLFCPLYKDEQWDISPMNARNNVNGVGTVDARRRADAQARRPDGLSEGDGPQDRHRAEGLRQPLLRDLQRAVLRRRGAGLAAPHRRGDPRDREGLPRPAPDRAEHRQQQDRRSTSRTRPFRSSTSTIACRRRR